MKKHFGSVVVLSLATVTFSFPAFAGNSLDDLPQLTAGGSPSVSVDASAGAEKETGAKSHLTETKQILQLRGHVGYFGPIDGLLVEASGNQTLQVGELQKNHSHTVGETDLSEGEGVGFKGDASPMYIELRSNGALELRTGNSPRRDVAVADVLIEAGAMGNGVEANGTKLNGMIGGFVGHEWINIGKSATVVGGRTTAIYNLDNDAVINLYAEYRHAITGNNQTARTQGTIGTQYVAGENSLAGQKNIYTIGIEGYIAQNYAKQDFGAGKELAKDEGADITFAARW